MALILNIETATPVCSAALSEKGKVIAFKEVNSRNSHASLLTVFIEELMNQTNKAFDAIDAVAVSMGPGSYTGLRIGVSTAKGICFAKDKPLIAIPTLQAMANGIAALYHSERNFVCQPMIDARRMEVYTASYTSENHEIEATHAKIIDEDSFKDAMHDNVHVFGGDGAEKCKGVITHANAVFLDSFHPSARYMASLAEQAYTKKQFEDLVYFEPYYLKDFVAGIPKVKGLR